MRGGGETGAGESESGEASRHRGKDTGFRLPLSMMIPMEFPSEFTLDHPCVISHPGPPKEPELCNGNMEMCESH